MERDQHYGQVPRLERSPASVGRANTAFPQSAGQTRWFAVSRAASGPPAARPSTARANKHLVLGSQTGFGEKRGRFAPSPLAGQSAGWSVPLVAIDSRP